MATGTKTGESAPPSETEQLNIDLRTLIDGFRGELDAVRRENERLNLELVQTRAKLPSFQPSVTDTADPARARREAFELDMGGGVSEGTAQLPVTASGRRIPQEMLFSLGKRFTEGSRVRIRRDVRREGCAPGVTWGDILDKAKSQGYGVVTQSLWFTPMGWKYKVRVPDLTGRRTDGFHDYELEPAS